MTQSTPPDENDHSKNMIFSFYSGMLYIDNMMDIVYHFLVAICCFLASFPRQCIGYANIPHLLVKMSNSVFSKKKSFH